MGSKLIDSFKKKINDIIKFRNMKYKVTKKINIGGTPLSISKKYKVTKKINIGGTPLSISNKINVTNFYFYFTFELSFLESDKIRKKLR